ncbi:MAG TPA: hypothetical protein VM571_02635 [Noviherbaspirillum sp.]|nr:hypothetical protein [Noviherbaspirillum sp.]
MAENFLRAKFEELPGSNTERPRLTRIKKASGLSDIGAMRRSKSYDSFSGRIDNASHLSGFEAGPTSSDFLNTVEQYMKACWAHDRSAAMDQISMQAYAETRRHELAKIPGAGYLAKQYGLQTADQITPLDSRIGLRIDHEMSSAYHRDKKNPEFHDRCFSLYKRIKKHGEVAPDPKMVAFAHSNRAFEQLKKIMPELSTSDPQNDSAPRVKQVSVNQVIQGLIAIECRDKATAHRATEELEKIGGTPNLYTVLKNSDPDSELVLTPDMSLDNGAHLRALLRDEDHGPLAVLEQLPSTHPMKSVAEAALSVLDGLKQLAERHGDTPEFKHSILIGNAVNALSKVVHALASTTEDSTRFFAGYQALLEETHLILAAIKPYTEQDFKQAAAAAFKTRAGDVFNKLKIADPEAHLFSSGMGAISLALDIAKELGGEAQLLSDHRGHVIPEYFEVPSMLDNSITRMGKSKKKKLSGRRVFTAILNPSTPNKRHADDSTNNWNAKKLVEETKKRLSLPHIHPGAPMYLVLDSTIEKPGPHGTSDMAEVLDGLKDAINDGSLIIFDCKSYQKQQSLHSGKIMAGRCSVIGKDGESTSIAKSKFRAAEQDINWMHNDDSQSLTHMVKYAQQNELSILKSTAQNAAFVHKYCLDAKDIPGFDGFEEGIPLGIIANVTKRISAIFPGSKQGNKIQNNLKLWDFIEAAAEFRNSFGFMRSSHLNVGGPFQVRLSIGQESREELIEKMYGLGWLLKIDRNTLQVDDVLKEITDIMERASQTILSEADVRKWGDTALRILEERAKRATFKDIQGDSVIAECKSLLLKLDKAATKTTLKRKPAALHLQHWAQQNVTSVPQTAQALREKLTAELERTSTRSSNIVADRMNIVGSAFAPVLPHLIDDVALMRTHMHRDPPGIANMNNGPQEQQDAYVDARYAPNMVASMLSLISTSFDNDMKGISRETIKQLDSFYNDILNTGLPGLSPSARTKMMKEWLSLNEEKLESEEPSVLQEMMKDWLNFIEEKLKYEEPSVVQEMMKKWLNLIEKKLESEEPSVVQEMMKEWLSLNEEKLKSEEPSVVQEMIKEWLSLIEEKLKFEKLSVIQEWADKVVSHAHLFPYSEEKAKVLEGIPEAIFEAMESETKNQLVRTLFAPLDVDARGTFIKKLAMLGHDSKIDSCLDFIDKELTAADDGWVNILRPDRLNSPPANSMEMNAHERRKIIQDALLRPRINVDEVVKNAD